RQEREVEGPREGRREVVSLRRMRRQDDPRLDLLDDRPDCLDIAVPGVLGEGRMVDQEHREAVSRKLVRDPADAIAEDRDRRRAFLAERPGQGPRRGDQLGGGWPDPSLEMLCDDEDAPWDRITSARSLSPAGAGPGVSPG